MLQRISELIGRCRTFLITAHERLDGDALGSEIALYHLLRRMGKEATIYNQDKTPENYRFLPASERIVHVLPLPLDTFEVAFVLDCGELARVGGEGERIASIPHLVNIDHHISGRDFSDTALVDPQASSTGELIYRLIGHMCQAVTREVAISLYTAILTDTGGFRYGNTGRGSLLAAADLVAAGADPQWISENVYESNSPAKIRLLSEVLPTFTVEEGGKVGSLTVTRRALVAAGALPEHTEGFVDLPRTVRGIVVSLLYSELPDGSFKVSMRSKGTTNVERVARTFGGGGHVNAAACRIAGELSDVRRRVMEQIRASVEL